MTRPTSGCDKANTDDQVCTHADTAKLEEHVDDYEDVVLP
jgi:hypothetical protein